MKYIQPIFCEIYDESFLESNMKEANLTNVAELRKDNKKLQELQI